MKSILTALLLVMATLGLQAQGGLIYEWSKMIGDVNNENIRGIKVSSSGYVYIVGGFQGTVDFDPGVASYPYTSSGNNDMFIAKYSPTGNFVWAKKVGSSGDDYGFALELGNKDSVVVIGYFSGPNPVDFDPGAGISSFTASGSTDGFVAKYDSLGNFAWVRNIAGTGAENALGLAIDGNQNIFVTGNFSNPGVAFQNSPVIVLTSFGGSDTYLAKYTSNGTCLYAKGMGGTNAEAGRGVAIDASNNVYIAGNFLGTSDFDPDATDVFNLTASAGDGFIAKYTNAGDFVWAEKMGGTGDDICFGLDIDPSGNLWVAGQYYNTATFGSFSVSGFTSVSAFLAKYSSTGTCLWAGGIGGTGSEGIAYALDVDNAGNAYLTGRAKGIVDFDPSPSQSTLTTVPASFSDAFIAKYDNSGAYKWSNRVGGTATDEGFAICVDGNSDVYAGGYFTTSGDFDPLNGIQTLTGVGGIDAYFAKYSQCPLLPAPASIAGIDSSCSSFLGQVFTATPVSGATNYVWSLQAGWTGTSTTTSITVSSNMTAGTIGVRAENACGLSPAASKTIHMSFPPGQPSSVSGSANACEGSTQTYIAPNPGGVDSYIWTLPAGWVGTSTTNTITVTVGSTPGNVSVAYKNFCGTSTYRSYYVVVYAAPVANISPAAPAICSGSSVALTASGGNGYTWSNGLGSGATKTVSPTTNTTYSVTVSHSSNACTIVKSVTVTVNNAPTAAITPATVTICNGQSTTLTASGGGTYAWSNGGGSNAAATFSPTTNTTYTVTVTNGGCTASASQLVTVNAIPTAAITPATVSICNGQSTTLTASGGTTYAWSNTGGSNAAATFSPTTSTTYNVTVSNGTCTATASRLVTVNALPTAAISPATVAICNGESATLTASGGTTYAWSNSLGSGAAKTVSPTTGTTYSVTVTDANSCTATASRLVTVNALPTAAISPATATICSGASQTLTASGGTSYAWSNSLGSGATKSVSPTAATTYTVTVTNANTCTATATSTVSVNPITVITTEPISQSTCTGSNITFSVVSAGVGLSYQWRKGASNVGGNSASFNIPSVAGGDAGNYTVIVTGTCGKDTSSIAALTVVTSANISQQPIAQAVCVGSPINLTVTGSGGNNTTYQWRKGSSNLTTQTTATLSIPSATAADAGNYYVIVTGSCGTINSDTVAISVNTVPTAAINPTTATICAGASQTLTASGGGTYAWSNSGGSNAATTFSPSANTTYTVTVTNNNCTASATATVNVTALPIAAITPSGAVRICAGTSTTLTATGGGTYAWSNSGGSNAAATFSPTSNTTYTVTVTASGCSATASKLVTINALPTVTLSPTSSNICPGGSQLLTAGGATTYAWGNGLGAGNSKTVSPTTTTPYSVTGTDANGCTATANATVTVGTATAITTQPNTQTTCVGGSVSFAVVAAGTNLTYQWRKGGSNLGSQTTVTLSIPSAVMGDAGNYDVIVRGDCGADTSTVAVLTVTGSLQISLQPQPVTACAGSNAILTVVANGANITYAWTRNGSPVANSNNDTLFLNNLSAANSGSYICNITSSCGNATSSAVAVTVNASTTGAFGQTVCFGDTYVFNNQTLTASGNYMDTLVNAAGCDSFLTLNLTVSPRVATTLNEVLCNGGSLVFNGQTISTAGQYLDTLVSVVGCDSFITLNVGMALATSATITERVCGSYTFGGQTLTSDGTYMDTVINSAGCDSVITLNLTILQNSTTTFADTICAGETYNFGGQTLTLSDTYTNTIANAAGCDSVISLELFVRPALSVAITQAGATLAADAGFATYQWQLDGSDIATANTENYTATQNGDYNVVVTDGNGCEGTAVEVTVTGVGIGNIANDVAIKLYPNPANEFLVIESSENIVSYEVRNVLGQVMLQADNGNSIINTSHLAAASYIIIINTNKGTAVRKFFKEY